MESGRNSRRESAPSKRSSRATNSMLAPRRMPVRTNSRTSAPALVCTTCARNSSFSSVSRTSSPAPVRETGMDRSCSTFRMRSRASTLPNDPAQNSSSPQGMQARWPYLTAVPEMMRRSACARTSTQRRRRHTQNKLNNIKPAVRESTVSMF